ncbi:hypothetical protein CWATWH0401_1402 [Crocosphaera watsonii WH 0401]|uniref:Uncharacterized protein n=1 Tax=Crocosphaera watsonii WH 0401 TaxID=555881 RepID=T2JAW9_CROWT|nr:hypothetical protein CWATWH0401_1402 [Crocosphaera watsonii WH 0401]
MRDAFSQRRQVILEKLGPSLNSVVQLQWGRFMSLLILAKQDLTP